MSKGICPILSAGANLFTKRPCMGLDCKWIDFCEPVKIEGSKEPLKFEKIPKGAREMPKGSAIKSQAQRRFVHAKLPAKVAAKMERETSQVKKLPAKVKAKPITKVKKAKR